MRSTSALISSSGRIGRSEPWPGPGVEQANLIAKRLILRAVNYLVARTETQWDDYLVQRRVFGRLSHLAPAVVIYLLVPLLLGTTHDVVASATIKLAQIYMIVVGVLAVLVRWRPPEPITIEPPAGPAGWRKEPPR